MVLFETLRVVKTIHSLNETECRLLAVGLYTQLHNNKQITFAQLEAIIGRIKKKMSETTPDDARAEYDRIQHEAAAEEDRQTRDAEHGRGG